MKTTWVLNYILMFNKLPKELFDQEILTDLMISSVFWKKILKNMPKMSHPEGGFLKVCKYYLNYLKYMYFHYPYLTHISSNICPRWKLCIVELYCIKILATILKTYVGIKIVTFWRFYLCSDTVNTHIDLMEWKSHLLTLQSI